MTITTHATRQGVGRGNSGVRRPVSRAGSRGVGGTWRRGIPEWVRALAVVAFFVGFAIVCFACERAVIDHDAGAEWVCIVCSEDGCAPCDEIAEPASDGVSL